MRRNLSRVLIALVVALTVPVQGVAAVSAGLCMALGQHGDATQQADHHHADGAAHHHGRDSGSGEKQPHCPPCVSCCAAAAIVAFSPFVVDRQPASSVTAAPPAAYSGVPPETLDRPPLAL